MILLILIGLFEAEFLNIGVDAGSWGRGATGLVYPITPYKNPASLLVLSSSAYITGSKLFGELANLISGGANLKGNGYGFGLTFVLHSVGDIHDTRNALIDLDGDGELDDGEELDESKITYFSSKEGALIGSYARNFGDFLLGASLKFIYKRIGNEQAFGAGTDVGIILNRGFYSIGALIRDFTTSPIFWEDRTERVAPSYLLGVGLNRKIGSFGVLMELDVMQDDYGFNHHLGLEIKVNKWLSIRGGFINTNLTAGIGLIKTPFTVDYASNIHPDLPLSHRVSLLYNFE